MKRSSYPDQSARFSAGKRYFHNPKGRRSSWDQWVDGGPKPSRPTTKWLKILGFISVLAALGGVIAGLALVLGR
ncbi:MAG: hypothetical protein DVB26_03930 [Verrucomicrobia bacterium]|nr:MAG: hypothetical protein DVB26_03930 [Verrucomicrobiota bacterium]